MNDNASKQALACDLLNQLKQEQSAQEIFPIWDQMSLDQKEELSLLVFEEGQKLILAGHSFAFHVFDLVRRIAPQSAKLQFKQGLFLFDYGVHKSNEQYLELAQKHISNAIEIQPQSVTSWYIWGDILSHLGQLNGQISYFQQAHDKYQKAFQLSKDNPKHLKRFLWSWALCCYSLGKHSGEAVDIKSAIDRFEQAAELGAEEENFWRDFGNAYIAMGLLISDERFLQKALKCFQRALQIKPTYFKGWLSSADAFQKIYEFTYQDDYLAQAHAAYAKAAELERTSVKLWINWGALFLLSGQAKEEVKHLQMALMKFNKVLEIDPKYAKAHSLIGETQALLGSLTSNLDYLKQAEKKHEEALEIINDDPHFIYRQGFCHYLHGQYFDDSSYYLMATEKFNSALNLNQNSFYPYYGLALTELALGKQHQDEEHFINAHRYFSKAALIKKNLPQFWVQWGVTHLHLAELIDDQNHVTLAIEKFETALTFYHKSAPPAMLLFHYGCALDFLGNFSDDPKDYEKAAKVLESLIKHHPNFSSAHFNLALVYSHLGEMLSDIDFLNKSIESYHMAIQDDSEDELIWNAWGETLILYAEMINEPLKKELFDALIEDAEKKVRQAIALGYQKAFYNLACIYSLKDSPAEALHYLKLLQSKGEVLDLDELMQDSALETLRCYEPFHEFIQSTPIKERFEDN